MIQIHKYMYQIYVVPCDQVEIVWLYVLWYTPPSKSLASLWLAGQLVVIPLLKWPFMQEYDTECFQISYDKC